MAEFGPTRSPELAAKESVPSAVFIGGASSTFKGLGGIDGVLKGRFGQDNVSVYNSLLSPELSAPDRFIEMGKDLRGKMEKGPLTVVAHSFGIAELYAAMQTDPEFFDSQENLKKLRLVLISPTIPKNLREGMAIGGRYARIGVQEGGVLGGRTLPGKTSSLRGIVSTGVLPIEGADYYDVQQDARVAAGKISHVSRATTGEVIEPPEQRDYTPVLTEAERVTMSEADEAYRVASKDTRKEKALAIRRRGVAAHPTLNDVNKTDYPEQGDTPMVGTDHKFSRQTLGMTGRLLKDTFVSGNVYDFVTALAKAGVKTNIVIPEFDTLLTPRKAQELGNIENIDVTIAAHATHGFPWADQPEWLLQLLDHQQ